MGVSVVAFVGLVGLVAMTRLAELVLSRRHENELARRGVEKRNDRNYRWMVMLHAGVLAAAPAEVILLRRPFLPPLAAVAGTLFVLATALRWWTIRTLGLHWNVQVMASAPLGVVTTGPFRWVRHPNYAGVFVELAALPLIHTAWITALAALAGNAWVLTNRLRLEEPALEADPSYRRIMAGKPRFLPKIF